MEKGGKDESGSEVTNKNASKKRKRKQKIYMRSVHGRHPEKLRKRKQNGCDATKIEMMRVEAKRTIKRNLRRDD